MEYSVIIPARYKSSRLPGKPLIDLEGIPMVIRTYKQCLKACSSDKIYVATEDRRIYDLCVENDIQVIMTSDSCLTGTDRIAECMNYLDSDIYINVQGDEPVFDPEDLKKIIEISEKFPNEIINGYTKINDEKLFYSSSIPKVVFRPDGKLLYMSRSSLPTNKNLSFDQAWRQVCIYAFPKQALKDFSTVKEKTTLESIEDIEILRFLEIGWDVRMVPLSDSSIAVDTKEDVEVVKSAIKTRGL